MPKSAAAEAKKEVIPPGTGPAPARNSGPVTPGIQVEMVALSKLMEWPGNPKEHDLDGLGESFERFGFVEPILFDEKSKRVVAGHGRRKKLLAWKESGHPPPDGVVVRGKEWFVPVLRGKSFRNAHEAEAYLLAANQLVVKGGYNATALAAMLSKHVEDAVVAVEARDGDAAERVEHVPLARVGLQPPRGRSQLSAGTVLLYRAVSVAANARISRSTSASFDRNM